MLRTLSLALAATLVAMTLNLTHADTNGDDDPHSHVTETGTDADLPKLAIATFGLAAGFPGYQLYSVRASIQREALGLAVRGSYTSIGPYISLAGRYYLPIPIPVPTYLSVEGGLFAGRAVYGATAGGHIPLGRNVSLDIEGGASRVTLLGEPQILPNISVGISYRVPFDTGDTAGTGDRDPLTAAGERATPAPGCVEPQEPDRGMLAGAFRDEVRKFLAEAKVVYAGTYKDLEYRYTLTRRTVENSRGRVRASYEGSVTEILTGKRVHASGDVNATFRWTGCSWRLVDADY